MLNVRHVKIGNVCTIKKGTIGLAKAIPGDYPLVTTGAERKTSKTYQFDSKTVCIPLVSSTGHGKKSLNYVHYQEGKFALGSILAAVIPEDDKSLNARYLHVYLQKNKDLVLVPLMRGAANVSLSMKAIANIEIPLPSLERQEETLKKIDSISGEYDNFLREITAQTELLKNLRQAIVREAIEGKLTARWRKENQKSITEDNHALKLLERINAEKKQLIKERKNKCDISLSVITDKEKEFNLPEGWAASNLNNICEFFNGKAHEQNVSKEGEYILVNSRFVSTSGRIRKYCNKALTPLSRGNIVIVMSDVPNGRALARCFYIDRNEVYSLNQRIGAIVVSKYIYDKYLLHLLDRNKYFLKFDDRKKQTNLKKGQILGCPVQIPPYIEQKKIVEKIERIMEMVDELEKQIVERKAQSEMLMQLVLRDAFSN